MSEQPRPRRRVHPAAWVAVAVVGLPVLYVSVQVLRVRTDVFGELVGWSSAHRTIEPVERRGPVVVAAHPEAVRAGSAILAAGGTAIDAAVAVQAALTLVEPMSSGIGGGAFLVYFHGPSGNTFAYDGRETAPRAAGPRLFLDAAGAPLRFPEAMVGGRSVGVPGVVHLLARAQARLGRRPWAELFAPAITLAEQGVPVTARLNAMVRLDPYLPSLSGPRALLFNSAVWPLSPGERLTNPELARTLRRIAEGGAAAFYTGPLAQDMVTAVKSAVRPSLTGAAFNAVMRGHGVPVSATTTEGVAGPLGMMDLAGYRAEERAVLCAPYRSWRVCTVPPPAGGQAVLQVLRMLERFDLSAMAPGSPEVMHLMVEAEALADADRARWVGDPAFARVPTEGLLDPDYIASRSATLSVERSVGQAAAGTPPGAEAAFITGESFELPGTSHFVVVDAEGSVASMTTSIEFGFGSHVLVNGYFLNNQLTDFSFTPEVGGKKVVNSVEPLKRPRSSMSPVIVFDAAGAPRYAVGSQGGPRIVSHVVQTLVAMLDHRLHPQAAVAQPHVLHHRGTAEVEDQGWPSDAAREAMVKFLAARGRKVVVRPENSGLHAVELLDGGVVRAGIDPRKDGTAEGP